MGASAAVIFYYTYHTVHALLPKHGTNLLYYKPFIDDVFCIWTGNLTTDWTAFKEDVNNFGVLKWDIESVTPSSLVNFLDMTLTICNNKIITKTYQKEMNLHLYIPPSSEHPPSCIKGIVYSLVQRYFKQNTYQQDLTYFMGLLYHRLIQQDWDRTTISKLILQTTA